MAHVTVGLTDSKEIHALLADVVYRPAQLPTNREYGIRGICRETIASFFGVVFRKLKPEAPLMLSNATHHNRAIVSDLGSIQY